MSEVKTRTLIIENGWAPEFHGIFFSEKDEPAYYFIVRRHLCRLNWSAQRAVALRTSDKLELPRHWRLVTQQDGDYLVMGKGQAYDLRNKCAVSSARENIFAAAATQRRSEKHLTDDDFLFGDYRISHKGSWGYACYCSDQKVWEFQGKGYLYTEMHVQNDVLYFGTGGQGGYFYALKLSDGTPLLQVKTGGTERIVQHGTHHYFLARDQRKSQLLRADLDSLTVEVVAELPGLATLDSPLQIVGDELHCATFEEKKGQLARVFWNRCLL